jgi:hypothetical protein
VLGTSGGMVSGLVWMTGSGRAAMATLLTALAVAAAATKPAPPTKSLLENMDGILLSG